MMPQTEVTNLLCAAARTLGEAKLKEMLPAPFVLHQVNDHDTGRHVYIAAKAKNLPWVHVWSGSVWHSSRYLFNDEIHPPGIQNGCGWASEPLARYFDAVKVAHLGAIAERTARDEESKARRERESAAVSARYAEIAASS